MEKRSQQAGEVTLLQARVAELSKALAEKPIQLAGLPFKVDNFASPLADSSNVVPPKSREVESIQVREISEDASPSSSFVPSHSSSPRPPRPPPPPLPPSPPLVSSSRNQIAIALAQGIRKAGALQNDALIASRSFSLTPPFIGDVCSSDLPPPPPPPPPPGTLPLPPPPLAPGHGGKRQPKSNPVGPRLKPFFWSKLDGNNIDSTVWAGSLPGFQLNIDDLVDNFGVNAAPTPSQLTSPSRKKNATTVLDISRANNIGQGIMFVMVLCSPLHLAIAIMLSRFKNNYSMIRCALLALDDSQLSIDDLKAISKHLPTTEEVSNGLLVLWTW